MKTRLFAAIATAALVFGGSGFAQTRPTARPRAEARPRADAKSRTQQHRPLARMLAQLDLTPEQKGQIQGITQGVRARLQAIRQDASLTPQQKRETARPILKAVRDQILGVLTPEQKQKWAEIRKRGPGREGFRKVLQTLDLTDAQKAGIREIMETQREKARIIRESNLSDADKRARVKALRQETRDRILAVLTPEQRQKIERIPSGSKTARPNGSRR